MVIELSIGAGIFKALMTIVPFIVGISIGGEKSSSKPVYQTFPGAFGWEPGVPMGERLYKHSGRVAGNLEDLLGTAPTMPGQVPGAATSAYADPLQNALLNPSYGPTSSSEMALLNSLMDLTSGRGAVRGLGAPTQSALAQSIAPTLVDLRQKNIENLTGAFGFDVNRLLGERGQNIEQRGQDISSTLGLRTQDIEGLLNLLSFLMPQVVGGNKSSSSGFGFGIGSSGGGNSSTGATAGAAA